MTLVSLCAHEFNCGLSRPIGISQGLTPNCNEIRLPCFNDSVGLVGLRDQTDRAGRHINLASNLLSIWHLETRGARKDNRSATSAQPS